MAQPRTQGHGLFTARIAALGVTVADAARKLGTSRQAVHRWVTESRLPETKYQAEIETWLNVPMRAWAEAIETPRPAYLPPTKPDADTLPSGPPAPSDSDTTEPNNSVPGAA